MVFSHAYLKRGEVSESLKKEENLSFDCIFQEIDNFCMTAEIKIKSFNEFKHFVSEWQKGLADILVVGLANLGH